MSDALAARTGRSALSAAVAEVDVSAIEHNLAMVRAALLGGADVMAIVKANAYGHGLPDTALHLESLGVSYFGVATPHEAVTLRRGGVGGEVLLLSPVHDQADVTELVAHGVSLTVPGPDALEVIRTADLPSTARVHLKVDTGMGRIGVMTPADAARLAAAVDADERLELAGTFTHLYASDDENRNATLTQLARFDEATSAIEAAGVHPGIRHAANSAAVFCYPDHHFDLVRPGIVLYGYYPGPLVERLAPGLRPAMRLTAPVSFVKQMRTGSTVSYGGSWRAARETVVATVRAGYADGYRRSLSGRTWVGHRGERLEVIGRICMDQLMVDATGVDIAIGDRVVLWGPGGPSAEDLGEAIGTVSYEMLTGVAARVGRRYEAGTTD